MQKEVTLPSGASLKIYLAPFKDARSLYQAMLVEAKHLKLDPKAEIDVNLWKDLFCAAFSSKEIEAAVWKCMERVTYNDKRITEDTFEPIAARDDYFMACYEVVQENIRPFAKSLYAQYSQVLGLLRQSPA